MAAAKKLPPIPPPEREPTVVDDGPAIYAVPSEPKLPPLPTKATAPDRFGRATNALLILFVVGLFGFLAGIALASTVLLGILDLNTGWLKDMLDTLKEFARHRSG